MMMSRAAPTDGERKSKKKKKCSRHASSDPVYSLTDCTIRCKLMKRLGRVVDSFLCVCVVMCVCMRAPAARARRASRSVRREIARPPRSPHAAQPRPRPARPRELRLREFRPGRGGPRRARMRTAVRARARAGRAGAPQVPNPYIISTLYYTL